MTRRAYYNENEPFAVEWLKNLSGNRVITPGYVDGRSIHDVRAGDLGGYNRVHFFAGIGVWDHALDLAGWGDRPIWTGSCPCQPFSAAGRRGGFDDPKHLWPEMFRLIRECRPPVIVGEQVSSKDGLGWFDLVSADLEGEGYAISAADLCAPWVDALHLRQRLYWAAYAYGVERGAVGKLQAREPDAFGGGEEDESAHAAGLGRRQVGPDVGRLGAAGAAQGVEQRTPVGGDEPVGDTGLERLDGESVQFRPGRGRQADLEAPRASGSRGLANPDVERVRVGGSRSSRGAAGVLPGADGERQRLRPDVRANGGSSRGLADPSSEDGSGWGVRGPGQGAGAFGVGASDQPPGRGEVDGTPSDDASDHGGWLDLEWLPCRDGKYRPVKSGLECLVDGPAFRLADGRTRFDTSRAKVLKAVGNAIVPQVAAQFLRAVMESIPMETNMILAFVGDNRFLSNFAPTPITVAGLVYPTAEHLYQASKTHDAAWRERIRTAGAPSEAKRLGQTCPLRSDWEVVKVEKMLKVVRAKFAQNPELAALLLETGEADLQEGNTWGDTFWGICGGRGENQLGKILMRVRSEIRQGGKRCR